MKTSISIVGFIIGFGLSFLSFGILFAGVPQWLQVLVTAAYFCVSFMISKKDPKGTSALMIGAAPLASLMLLFRDKNDSHALAIAIVSSWYIAMWSATKLKEFKKSNPGNYKDQSEKSSN